MQLCFDSMYSLCWSYSYLFRICDHTQENKFTFYPPKSAKRPQPRNSKELPFFWPKFSFFWPSRSLWEQFSDTKNGCNSLDVGWNRHNYLVELLIYLKKLICNKHLKLRHLGDGLEGNLYQNLAHFETNCFYFRNIP